MSKRVRNEFLDYILELLEPMEGISWGSMFGGFVIRQNDLPFGLIFNDELYLKVNDSNLNDYKSIGSEPFSYSKKGKTISISNWRVPGEMFDDPDNFLEWVKKAVRVAQNSKK